MSRRIRVVVKVQRLIGMMVMTNFLSMNDGVRYLFGLFANLVWASPRKRLQTH